MLYRFEWVIDVGRQYGKRGSSMAQRRVDMYGIMNSTLEDCRMLVEKALGIRLEEKYSSNFDDVSYHYKEQAFQEIRLYNNFDATKEGFIYEHLRVFPVLLNVAGLDDIDTIQKRLLAGCNGIELIGSSTIDTSNGSLHVSRKGVSS